MPGGGLPMDLFTRIGATLIFMIGGGLLMFGNEPGDKASVTLETFVVVTL